MRKIEVNLERDSYNIFLGENSFQDIKNHIAKYEKILVLTNEKIGRIYKKFLLNSLNDNRISYFEIPDGEENKTYNTVETIYDFMLQNSFFRNSLIISVGGGVVCDIGGFVASSYMRGIDFIQVPTSLLAMVDASIGGKVAINHKESKNLIGSFYQPKGVFIDTNFLKTLDKKEFSSGMGEVIKHSLLYKNNEYFNLLKKYKKNILSREKEILEKIIYFSCIVKKEIVTADEKEKGVRAHLNLGHTYAHALESIFKYKGISHGEAVAKGILFEIFAGGTRDKKLISAIQELFQDFNLESNPIKIDLPILINALKKDKKNSADSIKIVSFKNFGEVSLETLSEATIKTVNRFCKNEIAGVIDIGTNSVRVFISEIAYNEKENKILRSLRKEVEITALGEGVNESRILGKQPMKRTLEAIQKFYDLSKNYGASNIKGMATSAVRDAKNKDVFIEQIAKIGVTPYIISGELEAYLSFKGISELAQCENIGIIDIGGGSTEISLGKKSVEIFGKSFDIGAVRMTEMFFKGENYSKENIERCRRYIFESFSSSLDIQEFFQTPIKLYGVAGTVTTHVSVSEKMEKYDTKKVNGYILKKHQIEENLKTFLSKNLEERSKIHGLQPKRAPFVVGGTLILLILLELMGSENIVVSEVDNLEGATMILGKEKYGEF